MSKVWSPATTPNLHLVDSFEDPEPRETSEPRFRGQFEDFKLRRDGRGRRRERDANGIPND